MNKTINDIIGIMFIVLMLYLMIMIPLMYNINKKRDNYYVESRRKFDERGLIEWKKQ